MKRTFTIITVLISLSLIGIITIQVSWIKNMLLVGEEQIGQRVIDASKSVSEELEQHKGSGYVAGGNKRLIPEDFSLDFLNIGL